MTDSRHWYLVVAWATLAILGGAYAWVSQPIVGHPSVASATIRGAVIVAWYTLAFAVVAPNLEQWDWTKLALGFCLGGGWVAPALMGVSSAPMTTVNCGLVLARSRDCSQAWRRPCPAPAWWSGGVRGPGHRRPGTRTGWAHPYSLRNVTALPRRARAAAARLCSIANTSATTTRDRALEAVVRRSWRRWSVVLARKARCRLMSGPTDFEVAGNVLRFQRQLSSLSTTVSGSAQ